MAKYLKIILLSLMIFNSCEDERVASEEAEPVNPLIGTWDLVSVALTVYTTPAQTVTFIADGESTYETMIFTDQGTFSYQGAIDGDMLSGSGTWSSTDDILTYIEDGETTLWDYTMTDDDNWSCEVTTPENATSYGTKTEYVWTRDN